MASVLRMTWSRLAFLHWPVDVASLRPLIPAPLQVETFEGTGWLGITPFRMTGVRPLFAPPIPTAHDFPELNVRTYVRHGGRSGVWFFSLDAGSMLAVMTARAIVGLPYFHARMSERRKESGVHFECARPHPGGGGRLATFRAGYQPTGRVFRSVAGSFEHWSTERYSLFSRRGGVLHRLDIEHAPWPLQPGSVHMEMNTMAQAAGINLPASPPRVNYADRLDVLAHWPVRERD